jgi:hypothetical protein
MTTPEPDRPEDQQDSTPDVPPAGPAYSTPPPDGLPDADND